MPGLLYQHQNRSAPRRSRFSLVLSVLLLPTACQSEIAKEIAGSKIANAPPTQPDVPARDIVAETLTFLHDAYGQAETVQATGVKIILRQESLSEAAKDSACTNSRLASSAEAVGVLYRSLVTLDRATADADDLAEAEASLGQAVEGINEAFAAKKLETCTPALGSKWVARHLIFVDGAPLFEMQKRQAP